MVTNIKCSICLQAPQEAWYQFDKAGYKSLWVRCKCSRLAHAIPIINGLDLPVKLTRKQLKTQKKLEYLKTQQTLI